MNHLRHCLVLLALAFSLNGAAQSPPPPPPPSGIGGIGMVPPAEVLATVPDLNAAQQSELRKILLQRRDADEAAQQKFRAQFEALHVQERNEHERIEAQSSEQLRKLLGDEGYRHFAEWRLSHRGPPGGGMPRRERDHAAPDHFAPRSDAPPPGGPGRAAPSEADE